MALEKGTLTLNVAYQPNTEHERGFEVGLQLSSRIMYRRLSKLESITFKSVDIKDGIGLM